jgi:hypothetical protein
MTTTFTLACGPIMQDGCLIAMSVKDERCRQYRFRVLVGEFVTLEYFIDDWALTMNEWPAPQLREALQRARRYREVVRIAPESRPTRLWC